MSILNPFYDAIAWLVVHIHGLVTFVGPNWSWAIAIVLLTIFMRILLIPLFVKQIKSQRAMAAIQPQMKALQQKYKNDRVKQQEEMQKLWREAGVNPLMGCLPLLPQIPIFFALFHVLDALHPSLLNPATGQACKAVSATCQYHFSAIHGMTLAQVQAAAHAKIFGVPIAAAFSSPSSLLHFLGASPTSTRILCGLLTLLMVATTFITQRQLMARNTATGGTQMPSQQKVILYVLPLFFLIYGYKFPVGVLLYWLTTNLWSMGQQLIVIRRMDATAAAKTASVAPPPAGPAPGAKPQAPQPVDRPKPMVPPTAPPRALPADGDPPRRATGPSQRRPGGPGSGSNRRRRRRRR